jgi:hypothetical protein
MIDQESSVPGGPEGSATFHNAPHLETGPRQPEQQASPEELWQNPDVVTVSLRRHSEYDKGTENPEMRGSLARKGIEMAKESASEWAQHLPEGSQVAIYESPSYMPVTRVRTDAETGETVKSQIEPARARTTASLYETAVFGDRTDWDLDQMRGDDGKSKPTRRVPDERLGDILGSATNGPKIGEFYAKLRETEYGGKLTPAFWADYIHDKLAPELAEAIVATDGGADSLKLAQNLTDFLADSARPKNNDNQETTNQKRVELAVSHGETIGSFTHYLADYLGREGANDNVEAFARLTAEVDFNQGVDAHIAGNKMTVVAAKPNEADDGVDEAFVAVDLDDFRSYLGQLRAAKDEKSGAEHANN